VLAVADALLISITERAAELATLRAFGWPEAALRRMVITEGALTGLAGSVAGAALGLAGAAIVARQLPPLLFAAGRRGGGRRPGDLPGRTTSRAPAPPAARRTATRPGVSDE
jgi:ABC-type antimicrobial peptide transport system permease subunit